ncbi:MAG: peptide chain release factor-like protein [Verrucomicrobia bacterium]|nr:peptide chain release factor-like protein [Verrucomicrobiota bacterium]
MNSISGSADKLAQLERRMAALGIREGDLEEAFVHSGGPGGQNVNKASTCVMLHHQPTGVRVKCQSTRQQAQNRILARHLLLDKIERLQQQRAETERARIEKMRRQTRKRSALAKERMLADKARHAEKKRRRAPVMAD